MSSADAERPTTTAPGPSQASVPGGLVSAVVNLVNTGPVPLGAYAIAELTAVDADGVLASSERSALVTVTPYTTQGSAEIAGTSTDLILARHNGRLHLFRGTRTTPPSWSPARGKARTYTAPSPAC